MWLIFFVMMLDLIIRFFPIKTGPFLSRHVRLSDHEESKRVNYTMEGDFSRSPLLL
jgi:hypothetical protein